MELLRIVAMVLVMITHASFLSFGVPTQSDTIDRPFYSFNLFFFQGISVVCVNVFALLSGWFGISWKPYRILELLFQVFFFSLFIILLLSLLGINKHFDSHLLRRFFFLNSSDYWFFKAYLGLYILSPVLNTFIQYCAKKTACQILILFFCFQTIYGWLSLYGAQWFEGGYSAISFVGLYLLARYIRVYPITLMDKSWKYYFSFFILTVVFLSILSFILVYNGYNIVGRIYTYTNPLVILLSISLLLLFSKLKPFYNHMVNWIASSCFAVYLLHANELVLRPIYGKTIYELYCNFSGIIFIIYLFFFLSFTFVISILLDKVRLWLWNHILCK